ncbi:MAG: ABC transporter ATP-binding protein [Pseudomonadota bacterium]
MTLLRLEELVGGYGEADILHGVSLQVAVDEIVVIVGPNGAGKSTAMKAVFGLVRIRGGRLLLHGEDIAGLGTVDIVKRGVGFVPQTENVFPTLTVDENLAMGSFLRPERVARQRERVLELFTPLREKRRLPAGTLSGGQRQMVAMGRALMLEPSLLLLDEPTAGLSPRYVGQIFEIVRDVRASGVAVLMVEQNAKQALAAADRGYVLATGRNRFTGKGSELLADRDVAQAFLGG